MSNRAIVSALSATAVPAVLNRVPAIQGIPPLLRLAAAGGGVFVLRGRSGMVNAALLGAAIGIGADAALDAMGA